MERGLSDRLLTAVQQLEGGTATSLPYSTNIGRGSYSPAVSAGQGSVVREVVAPTYEFTGDVANALMRLANAPGAAFRTATNLAREQENPFAPFRELMPEGFSGRPAENQYAAIAREEANLPGSVSEIVGLIVEAGLDPSIAGEVALAKSVPSALTTLAALAPSAIERISNIYRLRRAYDAGEIDSQTANALSELLYGVSTDDMHNLDFTKKKIDIAIDRISDLNYNPTLRDEILEELFNREPTGLDYWDPATYTPFQTQSTQIDNVIDDEQREVLSFYTYRGDNFVNRLLRGLPSDRTIDDAFEGPQFLNTRVAASDDYQTTVNVIRELDAMFTLPEARSPIDTLLYRGEKVIDPSRLPSDLKDLIGTEIQYSNFVSTTDQIGKASSFMDQASSDVTDNILWVIRTPAGTPAIGTSANSAYSLDESEVLLPRGTIFRIVNVEEYGGSQQLAQRTGLPDIAVDYSNIPVTNSNAQPYTSSFYIPKHLIITADVITPSAPDPIPGPVPMVPRGTP